MSGSHKADHPLFWRQDPPSAEFDLGVSRWRGVGPVAGRPRRARRQQPPAPLGYVPVVAGDHHRPAVVTRVAQQQPQRTELIHLPGRIVAFAAGSE